MHNYDALIKCTCKRLAIGQVTGVELTCTLVDLINQCTVMWNVSPYTVCIYACTIVYF